MKEDYLDDLYGWITSQDEAYSNTYDLEGFKAKMQDTEYSSRMYDWINSIDDTFKDSHTLESFQDRVKKKDESQPTLEEEVTESVTEEETGPTGLLERLNQKRENEMLPPTPGVSDSMDTFKPLSFVDETVTLRGEKDKADKERIEQEKKDLFLKDLNLDLLYEGVEGAQQVVQNINKNYSEFGFEATLEPDRIKIKSKYDSGKPLEIDLTPYTGTYGKSILGKSNVFDLAARSVATAGGDIISYLTGESETFAEEQPKAIENFLYKKATQGVDNIQDLYKKNPAAIGEKEYRFLSKKTEDKIDNAKNQHNKIVEQLKGLTEQINFQIESQGIRPTTEQVNTYNSLLKDLETLEKDIDKNVNIYNEINLAAGISIKENFKIKEKLGTVTGALGDKLLGGIENILSGAVTLPMAFKGVLDEKVVRNLQLLFADGDKEVKDILNDYNKRDLARKDQIEMVRNAIEGSLRKDVITTEEYERSGANGLYMQAAMGVAESLPAMAITLLSGGAGLAAMSLQSFDAVADEWTDNPDWKEMPLQDLVIVGGSIGIIQGALERVGLTSLLSDTPLGKSVVNKVLKGVFDKVGTKTSKEAFERLVTQETLSIVKNGLVRIVGGTLVEGETGALQEVADQAIKKIYNESKGEAIFELPETFSQSLAQIGHSALLEALGGKLMTGAMTAPKMISDGIQSAKLTPEMTDMLHFMSDSPKLRDNMVKTLKMEILKGRMTKETAQQYMNSFESMVGVMNEIPSSINRKGEAFDLIVKANKLQTEMQGMNPNLIKDKQKELLEINNKLIDLQTPEAAVEEEGVVKEAPVEEEVAVKEAPVVEEDTFDLTELEEDIATAEKEGTILDNLEKKGYKDGKEGMIREDRENQNTIVFETSNEIIELGTKDEVGGDFLAAQGISLMPPEGVDVMPKDQKPLDVITIDGQDYTFLRKSRDKKGKSVVTVKNIKTGLQEKITGSKADRIAKDIALRKKRQPDAPLDLKVEGKPAVKTQKKKVKKEDPDKRILEDITTLEKKAEKERAEFEKGLLKDIQTESKNKDLVQVGENVFQVTKKKDGSFMVSQMTPNGKLVSTKDQSKRTAAIELFKKEKSKQEQKILEDADSLMKDFKKEQDDKILKFLDDAILKTSGQGRAFDASLGIPMFMVNTSLKIVKASYKAGKGILEAIDDALKYLESQGYKPNAYRYKKYVLNNLKQKQDAISEPSPEKVDVQESPRDRQEVGERDTKRTDTTQQEETQEKDKDETQETEEEEIGENVIEDLESLIAERKDKPKPTREKKDDTKILSQVENAKKSLTKVAPEVKIVVHKTDAEYRKATDEVDRAKSTNGSYNPTTKTIHINLSKAKDNTVAHEVFHALLLKNGITDEQAQAITKRMLEAVKRVASPELLERIERFSRTYPDPLKSEESIAELFGILASEYNNLSKPTQNLIKRWLNKLAKILGVKRFTDSDIIDLLNTVSRKVAVGEEIAEGDIEMFDKKGVDIKNANKRFQADYYDPISGMTYMYDKNTNQFKALEKDGFIDRNKSIKDFNGKYVFFHQPDAAFSGIIAKDGEILVEGKGGMYYPIKFHKDGYFWASTDGAAQKMASDLNKVLEQNGGTIYMALTSAPYDKLLSSTTMSNAVLDFFTSKMLDSNFKLSEAQLKRSLLKAAKDLKVKKIKNKKTGKITKKKVGLGLDINKTSSVKEIVKIIQDALSPEVKSFADRKNFSTELIRLMSNEINKNDLSVDQFGKLFSKGIQNKYFKGVTKRGKLKISTANMTQALSEMLTEPILKDNIDREKGGQIYAILEVNSKLKPVPSDQHESYPKALKSDGGVKINILTDRVNWYDVTEDFETDKIVSKDRRNRIFPTSGVSVRGLKLNTSNVATPQTRKQIVGENAELSDNVRKNLNVARQMEKAGKSSKDTRLATEWERGADGKWRYEISDIDAKIKINNSIFNFFSNINKRIRGLKPNEAFLSDFLYYPELFKAYPQLKNIKIVLDKNLSDSRGTFLEGRNKIILNTYDKSLDSPELKSVLVHEIQHAIQVIEGFARGGNLYLGKQLTLPQEIKNKQLKKDKIREKISEISKATNNLIDKAEGYDPNLSKKLNEKYRKKLDAATDNFMAGRAYNFNPYTRKEKLLLQKNAKIAAPFLLKEKKQLRPLEKELDKITNEIDKDRLKFFNSLSEEQIDKLSFDAYKALAGEVESRNVQTRMGMTESQRKSQPLESTEDVAREDQFMFFGGDQSIEGAKRGGQENRIRKQMDSPMSMEQRVEQIALRYNIDSTRGKFFSNQINHFELMAKLKPTGFRLIRNKTNNGWHIRYPNSDRVFQIRKEYRGGAKVPGVRYQVFDEIRDNPMEVINIGRDNNFSRAELKYFLTKALKLSAKEADALLNLKINNLYELPASFGDIGIKDGIKLFKDLTTYVDKLKASKKFTEQEVLDKALEYLQAQELYKNANAQNQDRMFVDTQKALGLKPTKDVTAKIVKLGENIRKRVQGAKGLQQVKKELRNYMREVLPKGDYTLAETKKLINDITRVTEKNLQQIKEKVLKYTIKKQVKFLEKRIDDILNGKYEKIEAGRLKGVKIDQKTKEEINKIRDEYLVKDTDTAETLQEKNFKLAQRFDELTQEINLTPEKIIEQQAIFAAINYNNSVLIEDTNPYKVEALERAEDALSSLIGIGRQKFKEQLQKDHKRYIKNLETLYKEMTGETFDLKNEEDIEKLTALISKLKSKKATRRNRNKVTKVVGKFASSFKSFLQKNEALPGLMDIIAEFPADLVGGSKTREMVYGAINESNRLYKQRMMDNKKVLTEKIREIYGKKWKTLARNNAISQRTGVKNSLGDEINLSPNEIAYFYLQYQDPANTPSFENKKNEFFGEDHQRIMKELLESIGVKVEIDKGDLKVTEPNEILKLGDWMVTEFYPKLWQRYNPTYEAIYRTSMPWNVHYAGRIFRTGDVYKPLTVLDSNSQLSQMTGVVGNASTKVRIQNNKPIQKQDLLSSLSTYLTDMEWFAAYGKTIKDINKLFSKKQTTDLIDSLYGDNMSNIINEKIGLIASQGLKDQQLNNIVNWMNDAFITSALAISPTITIKQLTSFVAYAGDIGWDNYIKYAVTNKAEFLKVLKEIRDNSVYLQERVTDDLRRVIAPYTDSQAENVINTDKARWFLNLMMFNVKAGDIAAIYLGGMPNYSYYKDQYKKKNPNATEQEAIDFAIRKFEDDTKNAQQSSDLQDKDYYQTSDAFSRSINMFKTTPKQYLRQEFTGIRLIRRGLRDRKARAIAKGVNKVILYHAILPAFFQYISNGLPGLLADWDDEDESDLLRAITLGNLNALWILGDALTILGERIQGKNWRSSLASIKGFERIDEIAELLEKATTAKSDKKRNDAWILLITRMTELGTRGLIPATNIKKMTENLIKASEAKDEKEMVLRMLNYSDYVIDGKKTKKGKGGIIFKKGF